MISVVAIVLLFQTAPTAPAFAAAQGFAPAPVPGMQMLAIAGILAPILWL